MRWIWTALAAVALCALLAGCGRRETRAEAGIRTQTLHLVRGTEPQELDPHLTVGQTEHQIMMALREGLVIEDPKDLHPIPGAAARWDISEDGRTYTFHLRPEARWSNGDPVTARDFLLSYQRALTPAIAYPYAYMLYVVKNAEAFNTGKLTNFAEVGFQALDPRTFQITLDNPTPYFLSLICHSSWFPVHLPTIEKYGDPWQRGSRWTRPGRHVGNGPFNLVDWQVNYRIVVRKSPTYWDAARVRLNEIQFHAMENQDSEERAFRAGQLHISQSLPAAKIARYQREHPELLRIQPFLGNYFYRINCTKPPLNDKRVRQALAIALDRESIVRNVTRGGQLPAYAFTPPATGGYTPRASIPRDLELARKLLADAGYPGGAGCPPIEILYNTQEDHKRIAEAIQQMWRTRLGIDARLVNQEWKVYLASTHSLNYQVARAGWIGDYPDPNTFLDMWVKDGGNNETGWSSPEYDRLIRLAAATTDSAQRLEVFQKAEAILLDELPILPIYYYTRVYVIRPEVQGWYPTIIDNHPYQDIFLSPTAAAGPTRPQSASLALPLAPAP